jgi:aspartyl-tRNA synthetase
MFKHIFENLEILYKNELSVIRMQYPSSPVQFTDEPLIIHWEEGMKMLTDAGHDIDVMADMSTAVELALGNIILILIIINMIVYLCMLF